MRHDWLPYTHPEWGPGKTLLGNPHRQCQHCGAIQKQVTEQVWMRVASRRWLPLIGRCNGDADMKRWDVYLNGIWKDGVQARHHSEAVLEAMRKLDLIDDANLDVRLAIQ